MKEFEELLEERLGEMHPVNLSRIAVVILEQVREDFHEYAHDNVGTVKENQKHYKLAEKVGKIIQQIRNL